MIDHLRRQPCQMREQSARSAFELTGWSHRHSGYPCRNETSPRSGVSIPVAPIATRETPVPDRAFTLLGEVGWPSTTKPSSLGGFA